MSLHEKPKETERRITLQAVRAKVAMHSVQQEPRGTCFAGFDPVCSHSLTPNIRKANQLRTSKYW